MLDKDYVRIAEHADTDVHIPGTDDAGKASTNPFKVVAAGPLCANEMLISPPKLEEDL